MILGWIQVDRMMVVGLGMDVVVIFDNIDYRVLLENTIEKDCGHPFCNQGVSF